MTGFGAVMPADPDAVFAALATSARCLVAAPFLYSGVAKLRDWPAGLAEVRGLGLPLPALVLAATVALQLGAGTAVAIGWQAGWAAFALAVFTLLATLMAHPFWRAAGTEAARQRVAFSEHLAIIGGLLLVAVHG